jgi:hypothetical protein
LRVIAFHAPDKRLIVLERKVGVQCKVVAYALLRSFHLQNSIETNNLVACANGQPARGSLDHLTGRRIERKSTLVAIFGIDLQLVL